MLDTQPLAGPTDGLPVAANQAAPDGERDGAGRRRRRRGGRGRNRGEGATTAADGADADSLDIADDLPEDEVAELPLASAPIEETAAPPAVEPQPLPRPVPAARPIVVPPAAPMRAEPYVLPIDALSAVASEAGLEWVHSDAEKVRQAQEAIAAAPKPVHVPREPKAAVAIDEGPLVLVETKKDLSQIRLPFDSPSA